MATLCLCCGEDANHRYACHRCVRTMVRWLRDIEDYAVVLHLTTTPLRRGPQNGSLGASFGPRSPMREDVAVFLDPRSRMLPPPEHPRMDPADLTDDGLDPHVDDPTPLRSLPGSLRGIGDGLRDHLDHSAPAHWTLVWELHYIAAHVEAMAHNLAVGELYEDLHELHTTARSLAIDSPPGSLGTCMEVGCDGLVYQVLLRSTEHDGLRRDPDGVVRPWDGLEEAARCLNPACDRLYRGLDLVRLGVAQEAS